MSRLSLRYRGDLGPLGLSLGVAVPVRIGARARDGSIEMACLGPDEWLIVSEIETDVAKIQAHCEALYKAEPHSLVDLSGRETTFSIAGKNAIDLISIGCARDVASIAVQECRRTVFEGVSVILWRDDVDSFRMDVWNSFATHVSQLLDVGARELSA